MYVGRFAPSPTGPLHFGSLVAAVGSYLDARAHGGQWLVRIEDVDSPRCRPGAADEILRSLAAFGFEWDGPVWIQSQRHGVYREVLEQLATRGLVFPCGCSRKTIQSNGAPLSIDGGRVYPGTCRSANQVTASKNQGLLVQPAWRLRVPDGVQYFEDRILGGQSQDLAKDVGDFILFRADGLYAYQLAVVVDDGAQGVTDVVRGADLLISTLRQVWLQACLGLKTPRYAHLPLVCNAAGEKLSKQTRAPALDTSSERAKVKQLQAAMAFLGLPVESSMCVMNLREVWAWGYENWPYRIV